MALESVTQPCEPRAEIVHRGAWRWYVRATIETFADGVPYWLDLGECLTEAGAERMARRWMRRVVRKRGWEEKRREVRL